MAPRRVNKTLRASVFAVGLESWPSGLGLGSGFVIGDLGFGVLGFDLSDSGFWVSDLGTLGFGSLIWVWGFGLGSVFRSWACGLGFGIVNFGPWKLDLGLEFEFGILGCVFGL